MPELVEDELRMITQAAEMTVPGRQRGEIAQLLEESGFSEFLQIQTVAGRQFKPQGPGGAIDL